MSTLRRRIKADDIKFRFDEGKYFIMDEPVSTHQRVNRPSLDSEEALMGTHYRISDENQEDASERKTREIINRARYAQGMGNMNELDFNNSGKSKNIGGNLKELSKDESVLVAANKLLNELKMAYSKILQEKEEHVLQLRGEVADLKTLVRVLESDNQRLKTSCES
jgi:hypothetical protein